MYSKINSLLASDPSREEGNVVIRALCIFDRFNKRVFQWSKANSVDKDCMKTLEKDLASGTLSRTVHQLVREASLGAERTRRVQYEGHDLILYYDGWFLIVAEADTVQEFSKIVPLLTSGIQDAVSNDPLSFGELLSGIDMPGKNKLTKYLEKVLGSQNSGQELSA